MIEKHQTKAGQTRYEVRLRGADGRERSRTFRTRKEAERYERGQQTELDQGEWIDPRNGRVTLARWTTEWQRTVVHLRPTTQRIYDANLRNHILPELGDVPLAKLTPSMLRGWLAGLTLKEGAHGRSLSLGSVAQVYRTLNRVLAAAVDNESLGRNPLRGVKAPRVAAEPMRFLSHEEVATLAEAIDPRYRALVLVAAYSGLRAGELIGLRRHRVDLLRRTITGRGAGSVHRRPDARIGSEELRWPPPGGLAEPGGGSPPGPPSPVFGAGCRRPGLPGARGWLPAPGELSEAGVEPGHRGRRRGPSATPRPSAHLRLPRHRRGGRRQGPAADDGARIGRPHPRPVRPPHARTGAECRRPPRRDGPPGPPDRGRTGDSPTPGRPWWAGRTLGHRPR